MCSTHVRRVFTVGRVCGLCTVYTVCRMFTLNTVCRIRGVCRGVVQYVEYEQYVLYAQYAQYVQYVQYEKYVEYLLYAQSVRRPRITASTKPVNTLTDITERQTSLLSATRSTVYVYIASGNVLPVALWTCYVHIF
jgi:hypothetical protein